MANMNEDKALDLLQKVEDKIKGFEQSSAAQIQAAEEGEATLQNELNSQRAVIQELSELVKGYDAIPRSMADITRSFATTVKQQAEGTANLGGTLTETEVLKEIKSVQNKYGVVERLWGAKILPMASDVMTVPTDPVMETAGNDAEVNEIAENAEITPDTGKVGLATLTAKKQAVLTYVPNELFEDAFLDVLGAWLLPKMARQMAKRKDEVVFNTATTGLLKSTDIPSVTMASGDGAFADISIEYILDMQDEVADDGLEDGLYLCHKSIRTYLRKLRSGGSTTSDGPFLWGNTAAGAPDTLEGYELQRVACMPAKSATAVSTAFALFGDVTMAMLVGSKGKPRIDVNDGLRFNFDQKAVRYIERIAHATNADLGPAACRLVTNAST